MDLGRPPRRYRRNFLGNPHTKLKELPLSPPLKGLFSSSEQVYIIIIIIATFILSIYPERTFKAHTEVGT